MIHFEMLEHQHWPQVKQIYEEGIQTGHATFETHSPDWPQWNENHLQHSRLIALEGETIAGWAALSPVSRRHVYAGVAEVSVYVAEDHRGKKVGSSLLQELIEHSEQNNMWTLQASIFRENLSSLKIHTNNGFRIIGYREKIGQINGVWRDTLSLERRSISIGI